MDLLFTLGMDGGGSDWGWGQCQEPWKEYFLGICITISWDEKWELM